MFLTRISGNKKYFTHKHIFNTLINTCIKIMFMKETIHSLEKVVIPNSDSASLLKNNFIRRNLILLPLEFSLLFAETN